jgi:hypothetical protein
MPMLCRILEPSTNEHARDCGCSSIDEFLTEGPVKDRDSFTRVDDGEVDDSPRGWRCQVTIIEFSDW